MLQPFKLYGPQISPHSVAKATSTKAWSENQYPMFNMVPKGSLTKMLTWKMKKGRQFQMFCTRGGLHRTISGLR